MRIAIIAAALALSGCANNMQTPVSPISAEYLPPTVNPGSNTVAGQAFLTQAGGGVVTCAGNDVRLIPVYPYSTEVMLSFFNDIDKPSRTSPGRAPEINPSFWDDAMKVQCDAGGDFAFEGVADGDYYIVGRVVWYTGQYNTQNGGTVFAPVTVSGGETKRVLISP